MSFETKEFFVAGVQFQKPGLSSVINDLDVGDELELKRDPNNQYDPNAVQILVDDVMIGHVKRQFSAEVSGALEAGIPITCFIVELDPAAKPWEQIKVSIEEVGDEELPDDYDHDWPDDSDTDLPDLDEE